ncbi:MAG: hypothetical protein D6807_08655 [Alphaproteobacteria bacterium]|nr:MAG: hypothetical protein D6807_08655 [Alphaproteobacteria bacterium]
MTTSPYSRLDRMLHHVAFASLGMQRALADIEERFLPEGALEVPLRRPVFVTSLPRAGTTLFLELLARCPDFATHSYRDMPFVLCPILWQRLSSGWRKTSTLAERAHGDGVLVSYDSPEAFDEVIWKAFWPRKYAADRIHTFTPADRNPEFEDFFRRHMRKLVARRMEAEGGAPGTVRYLSKNNALIGRIDLLRMLFPDADIVIPLRDPWSHVASLQKQHRRFLALHAEDRFAARYMAWLGHYEFGTTLRPIDFDGWLDRCEVRDPDDERFWLLYWSQAYEAVMGGLEGGRVHLVDFERARAAPREVLERLATALDLAEPRALVDQADRFREPTVRESARRPANPLERKVRDIYQALRDRCL